MGLRVFVHVWCEIDPALHVRVDRQTGLPVGDPADRLLRVSPLCRMAVAAAFRLDNVHVTAFALGGGHAEALRHALAAGAAHAVELRTDGDSPDAISVEGLADWLRAQGPDLVIADHRSGLLAGRLGWAHLAGLADLKVQHGRLRAVRFLERGDREVVSAKLPAAVRVQSDASRVPYINRARLQAVAECPIAQVTLPRQESARLDAGPLQPARARTRLGKGPAATPASASSRLQALMTGGSAPTVAAQRVENTPASAEQMAEEFVRYLLHHRLLSETGTGPV